MPIFQQPKGSSIVDSFNIKKPGPRKWLGRLGLFILLAFLVVLNTALVGYRTKTVFEPDYNITQSFWFDPFWAGKPEPGTLCENETLNPGDRFTTNSSLFEWTLVAADKLKNSELPHDDDDDDEGLPDPIEGSLVYGGTTLETCDVVMQYMDARVPDRTAEIVVLAKCSDVGGYELEAKASFTISPLRGKYSRPLLGAIPPENEVASDTNKRRNLRVINNMLHNAQEDLNPVWNVFLDSPGTSVHPIVVSGHREMNECPASLGRTDPCAMAPPSPEVTSVTLILSNTTMIPVEGSDRIVDLLNEFGDTQNNTVFAIENLAQTFLAVARIDLGNPNLNNFLLDKSMVEQVLHEIPILAPDGGSMLLRQAVALKRPLHVSGPSVIYRQYACEVKLLKDSGTFIVDVFVATLTMFLTVWEVFGWIKRYVVHLRKESEGEGIGEDVGESEGKGEPKHLGPSKMHSFDREMKVNYEALL